MDHKLTLDDIGKLAGVSRSTVSRVINDHPNVKDNVRERVNQIIQQTGYIPNPAARSLASRRSGIIGLVIPRSIAVLFGDPYFSKLTQGITQACYESEYILSLFFFYSKSDEKRYLPRICQRSFIDGLLVQATTDEDPVIPQLYKTNMPFLVLGRLKNMMKDISYVDVDNRSGSKNAVSHLIKLGYSRIAHVAGNLDYRAAADRLEGYKEALRNHGFSVQDRFIVEGDFSEEGGYLSIPKLLPHAPDAIFVGSDTMAQGVLQGIKDAGLKVPEDIAVVGFDDLPPASNTDPKLTTVRQPILSFGEDAVRGLMQIIENENQSLYQKIYDTRLVVRDSCGSNLR